MGVIFKLSSFVRFRQSCRCMKLETAELARREALWNRLQRADGIGRSLSIFTMALNFSIKLPFYGLLSYSLEFVWVFHWQPAAFQIVNCEKTEHCFFPHLWSAYSVSFHSQQAASLPMSIIIVGVGPAEFDGKRGKILCACVCYCACFVFICTQ